MNPLGSCRSLPYHKRSDRRRRETVKVVAQAFSPAGSVGVSSRVRTGGQTPSAMTGPKGGATGATVLQPESVLGIDEVAGATWVLHGCYKSVVEVLSALAVSTGLPNNETAKTFFKGRFPVDLARAFLLG